MNWLIVLLLFVILFIIYFIVQRPKDVAILIPEKQSPIVYQPQSKIETKEIIDEIPMVMDTNKSIPFDRTPTKEFNAIYFKPAKKIIDLDYPPQNIGCCSFSKPMSKALPIANIPICYATKRKTTLISTI